MLRILLVEDSPTDAELLALALEDGGLSFELQVAPTLARLRESLQMFVPDVAVSDMNLPGFDGLTALSLVRRERPSIPLVLLTGVDTGDPVPPDIRVIEKTRLPQLVTMLAEMMPA